LSSISIYLLGRLLLTPGSLSPRAPFHRSTLLPMDLQSLGATTRVLNLHITPVFAQPQLCNVIDMMCGIDVRDQNCSSRWVSLGIPLKPARSFSTSSIKTLEHPFDYFESRNSRCIHTLEFASPQFSVMSTTRVLRAGTKSLSLGSNTLKNLEFDKFPSDKDQSFPISHLTYELWQLIYAHYFSTLPPISITALNATSEASYTTPLGQASPFSNTTSHSALSTSTLHLHSTPARCSAASSSFTTGHVGYGRSGFCKGVLEESFGTATGCAWF